MSIFRYDMKINPYETARFLPQTYDTLCLIRVSSSRYILGYASGASAVVWPGAADSTGTLPPKIQPRYRFPRECGQPLMQDILTTKGGVTSEK